MEFTPARLVITCLAIMPLVLAASGEITHAPQAREAALRAALTFHAPFDGGVDAATAAGDPKLYSASSFKARSDATPGLPGSGEVILERGAGRFGDALRFTKREAPLVFFKGGGNMPYRSSDWSGTVSVWLRVDPAQELEPGFCDPVQITPRAWNDAAFFIEFEKREDSVPFRLGVYADFNVWNPTKRKFAEIPAAERPLVTVERPPFGRDRWTHVVFTFERFNTGRPDGVARLYLDGALQGELAPRTQTFTWDADQNAIVLGLNYIGLLDELAIFDRALSAADVQVLHAVPGGAFAVPEPRRRGEPR